MKLEDLVALGAYPVSGSVDAPGGINLGRLTVHGEVVLTPEGEEWVEANKPAKPAKAAKGKAADAETAEG
jgi:hypothetical protein